jgi:hypothetical protein
MSASKISPAKRMASQMMAFATASAKMIPMKQRNSIIPVTYIHGDA